MNFEELIFKRASQDFYRMGLTSSVVHPNLLFQGDWGVNGTGPYVPKSTENTTGGSSAGTLSGPGSLSPSKLVNIALAELGVKEVGNNSGTRVREFQSTTGAFNDAWCASFVTWCLKQSGVDISQFKFGKAKVSNWADWAEQNGRVKDSDPQPGDLFYYIKPGAKRAGHIGIVVEPGEKPGTFKSIEGNASNMVKSRMLKLGGSPKVRLISLKGI